MKELSLFTGAGGGLLGTTLLGFTHVGYVEINDYCQRVLQQRIKDGLITNAPIFGDIRSFLDQGYARGYSGLVDVITAGFPCQPFSLAGKQKGGDDERNMWPETIEVIRQVGPRYVLLENVPGLVRHDYFGTILGDLVEAGYNAEWDVVSAKDVGACHIRKRLWVLAYSDNQRKSQSKRGNKEKWRWLGNRSQTRPTWWECDPADISDSNSSGCLQQCGAESARPEQATIECSCRGGTQPRLGRVAYGVAHRVDRLKALGNGQVPAVVAQAWSLLISQAKGGSDD